MTFFDRVEDDTEQRVANLMRHMKPEQIEALRSWIIVKSAYYRDAEELLTNEARVLLSEDGRRPPDAQGRSPLAGGHITLRGISLFSLAMAEIMVFGKVQGPLPLESARFATTTRTDPRRRWLPLNTSIRNCSPDYGRPEDRSPRRHRPRLSGTGPPGQLPMFMTANEITGAVRAPTCPTGCSTAPTSASALARGVRLNGGT